MSRWLIALAALAAVWLASGGGFYQTTPDGKYRTNVLTGATCERASDLTWRCAADVARANAQYDADRKARDEADCEAQAKGPMVNGWTPETLLKFCRAYHSGALVATP